MEVVAAGSSDVGRSRHGRANEDSYHVGDSVFAVADGMGGHLAGEVASAMALAPITSLDGRVYSDSMTALTALRDAVAGANTAVVDKAASDLQLRGMGTTLTAVVVEGRRAHIAHVGDSRAYLLRDGVFSQLTTDHTLVQRLVDDGQITQQEAAQHPQRSIITRAIGVERQVDIDAMTLELADGDRILLCSDGLSGPVTDEALAQILSHDDLERIPDELIAAANDAGGPDNITAVVLDVRATAPTNGGPPSPVVVTTRAEPGDDDWAGTLGTIGSLNPHPGEPHRSRWTTLVSLVLVAALIGGGFVLGRAMLQRSWFVGVDAAGTVTIYRGLPVEFGPIDLSWPHEPTRWAVDEVPGLVRDQVQEGLPASDLDDARRIVENFTELAATSTPTPDPAPGDPATPGGAPSEPTPSGTAGPGLGSGN